MNLRLSSNKAQSTESAETRAPSDPFPGEISRVWFAFFTGLSQRGPIQLFHLLQPPGSLLPTPHSLMSGELIQRFLKQSVEPQKYIGGSKLEWHKKQFLFQ